MPALKLSVNMTDNFKNQTSQGRLKHGFALIEVLVTTVIIAVAVLGIAKMQASALVNIDAAAQRSQATSLAYEMMDRIRANQGNLDAYALKTVGHGKTAINNPGTTATSNSIRALIDLYEWQEKLNAIGGRKNLYQAVGTITKSSNIFTILITWQARSSSGQFQANQLSTTSEF